MERPALTASCPEPLFSKAFAVTLTVGLAMVVGGAGAHEKEAITGTKFVEA